MKMLFSCPTGDPDPQGSARFVWKYCVFQTDCGAWMVQCGSVPVLTGLAIQIKAPSESSEWGFFPTVRFYCKKS